MTGFSSDRPFAEPPTFDYDRFVDDKVPSDFQLRLLVPDDVELRTKYRDIVTEDALLSMYSYMVGSECYTEKDAVRKQFLKGLKKEVEHDWMEVSRECYEIKKKEPRNSLRWWEFNNLDRDGGTRKLEKAVNRDLREDVFEKVPKEVVQQATAKYGHLFPEGYFEDMRRRRLEWWNHLNLGEDGRTWDLGHRLGWGRGDYGWEEAMAEYSHLLTATDKRACTDREVFERYRKTGSMDASPQIMGERKDESSPSSPNHQEPKHHHSSRKPHSPSSIPTPRSSNSKRTSSITSLVLIPLLVMEVSLIYLAYIVWASWYT